jgi:hypothetical protein
LLSSTRRTGHYSSLELATLLVVPQWQSTQLIILLSRVLKPENFELWFNLHFALMELN